MPKIAEIEATPNPNAYRFVLKEPLTLGVPKAFASSQTAEADALASALFAIVGVTNVYYVDKWITITQDGSQPWPYLLKQLAEPIRSAAAATMADYEEQDDLLGEDKLDDDSDPRIADIRQILQEKVRPALMADGGDIRIVGLSGNKLTVRYFGACGSCPSSLSGTLSAIQNLVNTIDQELEVIVV